MIPHLISSHRHLVCLTAENDAAQSEQQVITVPIKIPVMEVRLLPLNPLLPLTQFSVGYVIVSVCSLVCRLLKRALFCLPFAMAFCVSPLDSCITNTITVPSFSASRHQKMHRLFSRKRKPGSPNQQIRCYRMLEYVSQYSMFVFADCQ